MLLSDLQNKKLVDINSGKDIGTIIDVKLDMENGKIKSLMAEEKNKFSFFRGDSEFEIKWDMINKIGEDVILVNIK